MGQKLTTISVLNSSTTLLARKDDLIGIVVLHFLKNINISSNLNEKV